MKLWILSDLHLEYDEHFVPAIPNADVCIAAGDITQGCANAIHWLNDHVAHAMPVIFVAGNHEFYRDSIFEGIEWGRTAAEACPRVHFLENDVVEINGVRFLGCTLWTDFALHGRDDKAIAWAVANFEGLLNDSKVISWRMLPAYEAFNAKRALEIHERSRRFLEHELAFDGQTVVVTHHGPHPKSVHERYAGSALNPSFVSGLSGLIESGKPDLWVHGHVHDGHDYTVGSTRIICNPRGYGNENPQFNPYLVVAV
ncbi:metallophosphoesterase [Mesorhizobium sp. A623]